MYSTFHSYLEEPCALSFQQMKDYHETILCEIGNDPDAMEIYEELIGVATRYASFRASWRQLSHTEKMDRDPSRTSCHNSLITHFNMLSRYLRMQGKEAVWRDQLGYEEDNPYHRKAIGDFGCYIVFVNSLLAR